MSGSVRGSATALSGGEATGGSQPPPRRSAGDELKRRLGKPGYRRWHCTLLLPHWLPG